jgi:hypothetical protein
MSGKPAEHLWQLVTSAGLKPDDDIVVYRGRCR